jgi:hypothetical protein
MPEGRQSPPPERQSGQQVGTQTKNAPDSDLKSNKDWSAKERQLEEERDVRIFPPIKAIFCPVFLNWLIIVVPAP